MATLSFQSVESNCNTTILSSVRGFSEPFLREIRTLQDLLRAIQPLQLKLFEAAKIVERREIGEGASYNVFHGVLRDNDVKAEAAREHDTPEIARRSVAVKQIKPPRFSSSSRDGLEPRISCLLKDIEVMRHPPLAGHPNILDLDGYGWGFTQGGLPLPFIVTEYAPYGTLQSLLRSAKTSLRQKLALFSDVASGLVMMHGCGVIHGDLKLSNILVVEGRSSIKKHNEDQMYVAKISDFGHSLLLSAEEPAGNSTAYSKKYYGTVGYRAPEICKHDVEWDTIDLRKCDVWALGLLLWEILLDGRYYYTGNEVQTLLKSTEYSAQSSSWSIIDPQDGIAVDLSASQEAPLQHIHLIASRFTDLSKTLVDSKISQEQEGLQRGFVKGALRSMLHADPSRRIQDVTRLRFARNNASSASATKVNQVMEAHNSRVKQWDFTNFRPTEISQIPWQAKSQILADSIFVYKKSKEKEDSARAALNVAFCHATGFGTQKNQGQFLDWIAISADSGLETARSLQHLLLPGEGLSYHQSAAYPHLRRYPEYRTALRNLVRAKATAAIPMWKVKALGGQALSSMLKNLGTSASHYGVLYQIPKLVTRENMNNQDGDGETALHLSCKLGDLDSTKLLLELGATATLAAKDGTLPIHWLFMFEEEARESLMVALPAWNWVRDHPVSLPQWSGARRIRSYIDPQFPTTFSGSPLVFAVAGGSTWAVNELLTHLQRCSSDQLVRGEQLLECLATATSLHMAEIFKLLWPHYVGLFTAERGEGDGKLENRRTSLLRIRLRKKTSQTDYETAVKVDVKKERNDEDQKEDTKYISMSPSEDISDMFSEILSSSVLERQVIHGPLSKAAAKEMFTILVNLSEKQQRTANIRTATKAAITQGDYDFMSMVAAQIKDISATSETNRLEVSKCLSNMFYDCTVAACNGSLNLEGSRELLELAISLGANINAATSDGRRPINVPIEQHSEAVLKWFIDRSADINVWDHNGYLYPLHYMLSSRFSAIYPLENILSRGANPNVRNAQGQSPLHIAVEMGLEKEVVTLLEHGASLLVQDSNSNNPLHSAVAAGSVEITRSFLSRKNSKVAIQVRNSAGETPFALAARLGNADIFRLLSAKHPDHKTTDTLGRSPLHLAAEAAHPEIIEHSLATGANPNCIVARTGMTPLLSVLKSNSEGALKSRCAELLLDAGADVNAATGDGQSVIELIALADFDDPQQKRLLARLKTKRVRLPPDSVLLHFAASAGNVGLTRFLLESGCPVDLRDKEGSTPLHRCVESSRLLLTDDYVRNNELSTATWSLLYRKHSAVAGILLRAGADLYAVNSSGYSVLQCATIPTERDGLEKGQSYHCCIGGALMPGLNPVEVILRAIEKTRRRASTPLPTSVYPPPNVTREPDTGRKQKSKWNRLSAGWQLPFTRREPPELEPPDITPTPFFSPHHYEYGEDWGEDMDPVSQYGHRLDNELITFGPDTNGSVELNQPSMAPAIPPPNAELDPEMDSLLKNTVI